MFDLKVINAVLSQLEEERGIPKEKIIEAIEIALGTAYKKEYGKKGQIIKAKFSTDTGDVEFWQTKIVVDKENVIMEDEEYDATNLEENEEVKIRYNPEHHILIEEARLIKKDVEIEDEVTFPLEKKDDFGRIAAQTAKQVITQKIREAEKTSVMSEYGEKEGEIVSGTVERVERGTIYLDMGRAIGMLAYNEQIPGERFRQGERVRAYLFKVDETPRGIFLKLSRSHPKFLAELFKAEVPELSTEIVQIKAIAREAGSRSKVAVYSEDEGIDPVGALVGQRGVRVTTIMSELGGEKIDVIEWSEDPAEFINEALSPAKIIEIDVNEEEKKARVVVSSEQQSLAIGKGGQNVRLAAKLTGWKIDIESLEGENAAEEVITEEKKDEEVKTDEEE
ncbi:transcription termination/antitermination protein NusA [Candidatus Parcubacteria bacterium]|nr:transcription termination/antitermination protein NusA [Candidatus Parcubacteria bacterium]